MWLGGTGWCGVVWCGIVWYGMVWHGIAHLRNRRPSLSTRRLLLQLTTQAIDIEVAFLEFGAGAELLPVDHISTHVSWKLRHMQRTISYWQSSIHGLPSSFLVEWG